jgi:hypothetical protein
MKSRESIPLDGRLGHPYIEFGGQVSYKERGFPDRVVVSLREGELVSLACKEGRLVLVSTHVLVWLLSRSWSHITAWHGVMPVSVVMALLAWWWFANCPVRCELAVAFVIVSCSFGGVVVSVRE